MCTNLMLAVPTATGPSDEKMYVSSRCMEMPGIIEQALYVMPKGQQFPLISPEVFSAPDPLTWTSEYHFVGIASSDSWEQLPNFCDGLNEHGLSVGALWLEPGTQYPAQPQPGTPSVSSFEFPAWILGMCTTVGEVKAALGKLVGASATFTVVGPQSGSLFVPLHYIVTDSSGASIIVEFSDGETLVYDSTNGVMANAPTYDWHLTNVRQYDNITLVGPATSTTAGSDTPPVGGQLLGLPGDSLSSSRFIRAWYLSQGFAELEAAGTPWLPAPAPLPTMTQKHPVGFSGPEQTAVVVAMQLVQICMGTPYGMLLEQQPGAQPTYGDYTMWTCVRDHTNLSYYFVGAFSAVLSCVDLQAIDFASMPGYGDGANGSTCASISILPPQDSIAPWSIDVTNQFSPVPAA